MQSEKIQRTKFRNCLRKGEGFFMNHPGVHPVDLAMLRATRLFGLLPRSIIDRGMEDRDQLCE